MLVVRQGWLERALAAEKRVAMGVWLKRVFVVRGLHLIVPRGIHFQQRGLALANGVANIVPTRAFRVYVSNFSRIPARLAKGMNIGTVRPLTPKSMGRE